MNNFIIYHLKYWFHLVKTGLFAAVPAQIATGHPQRKLKILAITGTDGKTTSSTLLYHVMRAAGFRVGLITTVAAYILDEQYDTGFHVTTPSPQQLYTFMKKMVDQNIEYLVLETTSHGLFQHRTWGIKPLIAGITNITHEHFDYHLDYQHYVAAKDILLSSAQKVILNADDRSYPILKPKYGQQKTTVTYSNEDQLPSRVKHSISARFPELYNQMNARLVYRFAQQLKISDDDFSAAITTFAGVPGRMEIIETNLPFSVIVDFAHTPNALSSALQALRKKLPKGNKLIAVFGSAGLRDASKRPLMGLAGVTYADLVVLTAEDPRTEDVWSIIRQIKEQLNSGHQKIISIPDRKHAIEFALSQLASQGDIVGIFGKGHEQSMCYGTVEYPWSDKETVIEIAHQLETKS